MGLKPVPPPVKCTIFYESRSQGWSNTWWINKGNLSDAADDALLLIAGLVTVYTPDVDITYFRVSDASVPKKAQLFGVDAGTGTYANGLIHADSDVCAPPDVCLVMHGESATFKNNYMPLHAFPLDLLNGGANIDVGNVKWIGLYNTLTALIQAKCVMVSKGAPPLVEAYQTITRDGVGTHHVGRPFSKHHSHRRIV